MVSGYCFFSFFVRAFCMRLLNSIHDEIANRSFACWFCLDFSLEIAVQTNRSKGKIRMSKGDRRKEVCRLFGRQKHMHIASWAPQLPPGFEFTFTLPPENDKPLTAKTYRRIALPRNNYRRIALPPKKYRHVGFPLPPKSLPPKSEKPLTAKKLPPFCITAEKIPPYFGLPLPPKSLPTKTRKPRTA